MTHKRKPKEFDGFGTGFRDRNELVAIVQADNRFWISEGYIYYRLESAVVRVGQIEAVPHQRGCAYRVIYSSSHSTPDLADHASEGYYALRRLLTARPA